MNEFRNQTIDSKSALGFQLGNMIGNASSQLKICGSLGAWIVLVAILFFGAARLDADQELPHEQLPTSWKFDAELTDLFFLNEKLGWAVGAQGVILRTTDGGENWNEISQASGFVADDIPLDQKLRNMRSGIRTRYTGVATGSTSTDRPIRCRFESVHFVDANHGWVAGGYDVPYVGRSRAVVMRTTDGGQTWQPIRNLVIPRINKIHFSDHRNGWAVGRIGNLFQTGVFYTSNGGQTWASKSSAKMPGWKDAVKTQQGLVALSYAGKIGLVKPNQFEHSVMLQKEPGKINQIHMVNDQNGWAIGDHGAWVQTQNGGLSWTDVRGYSETAAGLKGSTFSETIRQFDLQTIAVTDEKVWMAGDPGTILFGIDRNTGETTVSRLPSQNRINQLYFADANHGWAVGSFGTIMATQDGGEHWQIQRGKNRRVAVLTVSPDYKSVPFELFSKYGSEENVLCASVLLGATAQQHQMVTQATERLGGTTSVLISDEREKTLQRLVRSIRMLQPNVVVCNSAHVQSNIAGGFNCALLVQDAIRMAGDQSAFPEQIEGAGLNVWGANRLAILDRNGSVGVDPHQLLPRTGKLIEDQIAISRAIVGQTVLPETRTKYRITELTNNGRIKSANLLSGLAKTNLAFRSATKERHGSLASIHQISAKRKTFDGLAKFECNNPQDLLLWRQKVQSLALKMDSDIAGVWLMQLAERYLVAGKLELAAGSAELLAQRWSDHAFAPAALAWLAHYYGSDEFGQIEFSKRVASGQIQADGSIALANKSDNEFDTAPQVSQTGGVSQLVWAPTSASQNETSSKSKIKLASNDEAVGEAAIENARQTFFDQRHGRAGVLLKQLSRRDPELIASGQFKMMDAHLARRISGKITNGGRWKSLAKRTEFGNLAIAAQRELVLGGFENAGADALIKLTCQTAVTRPVLDGKLDEPVWQNSIQTGNLIASRVRLRGRESNPKPDTMILAHDDEFLYVGINCQKIKGNYYNTRKEARTRDADLSRRDRVELLIDVDRDYRSSFKFVVDHRGWVNESCAGCIGWDPEWYVSQSEDATSWTVEAAIPISHVSSRSIDANTTWAIQTSRRMFGSGNVWLDSTDHANPHQGEPVTTLGPLQIGLESHPSMFDLVNFQTTENVENSDSNRPLSSAQVEPMTPIGPTSR